MDFLSKHFHVKQKLVLYFSNKHLTQKIYLPIVLIYCYNHDNSDVSLCNYDSERHN